MIFLFSLFNYLKIILKTDINCNETFPSENMIT